MKDLNVVVWGLGPHAIKNILPALDAARGVRLFGVFSRNAQIVAWACERYGCVKWQTSEQMLSDPSVDVVFLATPTGLHARDGMAALSAGKHLWCEKPATGSREQTRALIEKSIERGVTLTEGLMYLYHPQFEYLLDAWKSGALGRVHTISCRFGIPPLDRPSFRTDPDLGGSALLDVGSYPVSALTALFPQGATEVLFSEISTVPGSRVDTSGLAVLRCPGGVTAVLEWRTDAAYRSDIDLWGTEGSISTERVFSKPSDHVPRYRFLDRHGRECLREGQVANAFVNMCEAFRGFVTDQEMAESERRVIARRARLIDSIRNGSQRGGGADG